VEAVVLFRSLLAGKTIALLQPAGTIAEQQRDLILFASALGLLVILPVFALLFFILWRYRDGNVRATYAPEWDGSKKLESIWWGIPMAIILVLAIVTWNTSHSLDPYRPLAGAKPVTVQVVALQWKWLFIYPEQNIATVNYLKIPHDIPIEFKITSDAPMNSFWIPQLGGQVYAMPGMETKLHLMADEPGVYQGMSANISGEGFSGMRFTVDSVSNQEFNNWVQTVWQSPMSLTQYAYDNLVKPSSNEPITLYASRDQDLYNTVIEKYMSGHSSHVHREAY
jgi:cytochrome o ubiquinol oxidase subunit 2